jgi:hypothetical protein
VPQVGAALGSIALNLALGVGASVLSNIISPQKKTPQSVNTSRGFSFEMAVGESAPVSAVVGLGRATGKLIYLNEYGENNDYLQMVVEVGCGWHDGMEAFLIDEKPVTLVGSNADPLGRSVASFTLEGVPYMHVKYYTGAPGQAADAELVARSNPAGRWTPAHKMTGRAYYIITFRYHADLYSSSLPLSGSVWRGLRLLDWRVPGAVWGDQSTYVFTRNPAVIRYNFRRGIYVNGVKVLGQGFSAYANDLAGYTAAANVCDEPIFDPVSNTIFARYEFGREIGDDEEKLSVLSQLDDSYCGSSFKRGGADVPLPAQQLVSAMTLTNADRMSGYPVTADRKGSVSSKRTMFHGQFVSKDVGWGLAPFTPRIDTTLESVLGGRRAGAVDQPYEYSQERAQFRAEIRLRRQFYPATRVETFTPKALALEPGDPIIRDCEWGAMLMIVEKVEPLERRMGVTVTMTEWSNTIVPASGDSFVVLPPGPGAGPGNPDRTIAVSGFNVVAFDRAGGGAVHPYGKATWTPITDPNVDQVMIRVWPTAGTEADDAEDFFADSKLTSTKLVGPLQPLTEYTRRAIPIRSDGRLCVWSNPGTFVTGAETVPQDLPDGSVTPEKLAQELLNERGFLVGAGEGSLAQRLAEYELRQAQAELAALTDQTNSRETFSLLKAQNRGSLAAIAQTRRVIAEETAALAELIDEVAVEIAENLTAGGLFQITGEISNGGASAEILMKVRAAVEDLFSEAAFRMRAEANGQGGTLAYIDIMADRLRFISTNGAVVTIPFKIETIAGVPTVVVQSMRFRDLTSLDGETIILDGTTGFFSFGAG